MPFPNCERMIYSKNTLRQVICQLRFPSILRIDSQLPVEFQERIRAKYPIFRERTELIANQIPQSIMNLIPLQMKESLPTSSKIYEFISADENWIITLTRESIALTTNRYTRWMDFKSHFEPSFQSLVDIYSPAFFSRIGLRYQNIIQRSDLELTDAPWSQLLQPYIAGPLSNETVADSITSSVQTFEVSLENNVGMARVQHGLVDSDKQEQCYLIDSDLFTDDRTEADHAIGILDGFNKQGTRLFRWCITTRLHESMGPAPVRS